MVSRLRGCSYRCRRGCEQRVASQMQIYAQIWLARLKNAALQSGFSRSAVAARGRLIRGHGAPQAAQRSRSTRRWPTSNNLSLRLPEPSRNGTLGHEPSARALGARPARRRGLARARQLWTTSPLCNATKSSERRPHYRALPRSEPDTDARRSGRRHKDERPRAATASQRTGAAPACVTSDQRCHPAPSPARWA